jgi:hypothetical protein
MGRSISNAYMVYGEQDNDIDDVCRSKLEGPRAIRRRIMFERQQV